MKRILFTEEVKIGRRKFLRTSGGLLVAATGGLTLGPAACTPEEIQLLLQLITTLATTIGEILEGTTEMDNMGSDDASIAYANLLRQGSNDDASATRVDDLEISALLQPGRNMVEWEGLMPMEPGVHHASAVYLDQEVRSPNFTVSE